MNSQRTFDEIVQRDPCRSGSAPAGGDVHTQRLRVSSAMSGNLEQVVVYDASRMMFHLACSLPDETVHRLP